VLLSVLPASAVCPRVGLGAYHLPSIIRWYSPAPSGGIGLTVIGNDDSVERVYAPETPGSNELTIAVYVPATH
jgi:hypothetical protein